MRKHNPKVAASSAKVTGLVRLEKREFNRMITAPQQEIRLWFKKYEGMTLGAAVLISN